MIILIYISVVKIEDGKLIPVTGVTHVACIVADGPSGARGKTYTNVKCIRANHSTLFLPH